MSQLEKRLPDTVPVAKKKLPDAELQPVKPPAAQAQSTPATPASSMTPTYGQTGGGSGANDASLSRAFTQDTFMAQLGGAAGQNTQGAGPAIPDSAMTPTYSQGAPDPDAPAVAGTTVTNSSPFTGPTGTPTSTEYPTVVPGKVYTQAELVAFQQAMSAADMAVMKERQQTMYRAGKYSDKPSGEGWVSIPLESGGYYEYRAEPVWQGYWSTSPNAGTGGGAGAGAGGTDTGTGGPSGRFDDVAGGANPATDLTGLLEEWKKAAAEQANGQIDYAVAQAITELERALEDSKAQYKEQAEGVTRDEMQALDNSALYAEMRGDKGGIGQSQYNEIQAAAAQNRLAVRQAQTKLSTDTARQIADLRAQGEFEKADKALEIAQTYLSQLISLEQWAAEFNLSQQQFQASLQQWQAEFDLAMKEFNFNVEQTQNSNLADMGSALLNAGIMPDATQLAAMDMTATQAQQFLTQRQLEAAKKAQSSDGTGTPAVKIPALGTDDWYTYVSDAAAKKSQSVEDYLYENRSDLGLTTSNYAEWAKKVERWAATQVPENPGGDATSTGRELSYEDLNHVAEMLQQKPAPTAEALWKYIDSIGLNAEAKKALAQYAGLI